MTDTLYIRDDDSLAQLAQRLQAASPLAIDTEFIRERTYYPAAVSRAAGSARSAGRSGSVGG